MPKMKQGQLGVHKTAQHQLFDPYTLEGTPVQAYNAKLPVYEESCFALKFSTHHRFPKTALASHPGSGSTWSRHLIQQISGKSQNT